MKASLKRIVLLGTMLAVSGCSWGDRNQFPFFWSRNTTFAPGDATSQRIQAEQFDPYPENYSGPEMLGTRPPDYQAPAPEAVRTQRKSLWSSLGF